MQEQILKLKKEYEKLEKQLSRPEIALRPFQVQTMRRRYFELKEIMEKTEKLKEIEKKLRQAKELLEQEKNEEMIKLAEEEIASLEKEKKNLEKEIEKRTKFQDPHDFKNAVCEIRAGTGGEEAALFAADLYRMYSHFAEKKGWKIELLNSSRTRLGGFKEITFNVIGPGAYGLLKFEAGVHRVQRIPKTEKSGRVHTSTASVAILPEAEEIDLKINPEDLKIDVFRSSGPGGQSVNTTDSAVRIHHLPTNIIVSCQDEKSQHKNKARALKILRSKLLALKQKEEKTKIDKARKVMVGGGKRAEKIRTYNFPQNRVTDHRINLSLYNLEEILDGKLDELIKKLKEADAKTA